MAKPFCISLSFMMVGLDIMVIKTKTDDSKATMCLLS